MYGSNGLEDEAQRSLLNILFLPIFGEHDLGVIDCRFDISSYSFEEKLFLLYHDNFQGLYVYVIHF